MRNGSLWMFLGIVGGLLLGSAADRNGIDLRGVIVSGCEWVTGREAGY